MLIADHWYNYPFPSLQTFQYPTNSTPLPSAYPYIINLHPPSQLFSWFSISNYYVYLTISDILLNLVLILFLLMIILYHILYLFYVWSHDVNSLFLVSLLTLTSSLIMMLSVSRNIILVLLACLGCILVRLSGLRKIRILAAFSICIHFFQFLRLISRNYCTTKASIHVNANLRQPPHLLLNFRFLFYLQFILFIK